jgi:hypothetical protein
MPQMLEEPDLIFIPQEARGRPIAGFLMSARLAHVLQRRGIQLFGQLHGLTFSEFAARQNCGQKTLRELRELVRIAQRGQAPTQTTSADIRSTRDARDGCLMVVADARELNPFEFPISGRLEKVLQAKGVTRLGDLHGVSFSELRKLENCGTQAVKELFRLLERVNAGEFQGVSKPFSMSETGELLRNLNEIIGKLPPRNRDILLMRFSATDNRVATLEEIGSKFKLTRERVRQIVAKALPAMRKEGGPRLVAQLRGVAETCRGMVCPLTPMLLAHWLGQDTSALRFSLGFYIRVLGELSQEIPAWPNGQEPSAAQSTKAKAVLSVLEEVLQYGTVTLPLATALERTSRSSRLRNFSLLEFLETVKHAKTVLIQFPQPDQPEARLRHIRLSAMAKTLLETSDEPLTPEEILSRAEVKFGSELVEWDPRTVGNALTPEKGFYLLGPRAYGVRRHFKLQKPEQNRARRDAYGLLRKLNRPVSTLDMLDVTELRWVQLANKYELAQILREDKRFTDLGRLLFGLAEWGVEERKYVKDLVPEILRIAGQPLNASQIAERLQQLRSVAPTSLMNIVRHVPEVRDYGFGYFGLKSWGDLVKESMMADNAMIDRVIRRSEPPVTFNRLCEALQISVEGALSAKLWQTCASLRSVIRSPDKRQPTTLLLHKSCSLERALVATARAVNRPLPLYEFQWELNARFGPLFAKRSNMEVRRCLEQSRLFLRNADGEFILDIHLDQLGLDEEAIRKASHEILSASNEIVGCDDLIERLEAEGKVWEELSPDILGSLLREDAAFQEVGRNRFRAKPCKR